MSKTSANAGTFAHAADAAPFRSAPAFDPLKTYPPWTQPGGVERHRPVGGRLKRAIDVALALLALVLLAPIILLVAMLLRFGLGRPILVAEDHIGFGGQVFTAYTFHTSPIHRARKPASDPTIATCLGAVRDSGLDRLPQLLSILRGDMSFVGPRPVTPDELDRRGQCAPDYFTARPGLVGLRRAHRSDHFGYGMRAALDRYYARRWSIWLDLAVLASAVAAVRSLNDAN
jgi:exopolysaccharide production protein ExoY